MQRIATTKTRAYHHGRVMQGRSPAVVNAKAGVIAEVHSQNTFGHWVSRIVFSLSDFIGCRTVKPDTHNGENKADDDTAPIPSAGPFNLRMDDEMAKEQEEEPQRSRIQQNPESGKQHPIDLYTRADTAHQGIGTPQACALQPRESDHINKTEQLQSHRPRYKNTKACIIVAVHPYR